MGIVLKDGLFFVLCSSRNGVLDGNRYFADVERSAYAQIVAEPIGSDRRQDDWRIKDSRTGCEAPPVRAETQKHKGIKKLKDIVYSFTMAIANLEPRAYSHNTR